MSKKTGSMQKREINLPKNIQQIGSTENGIKVYLEDYSGTYLRRILVEEPIRHGILLGKKKMDNKQTYMFIQAVLSVEIEERDKYWKYDWKKIYELMQKYFIEEGKENLEILGWAMSIEDYKKLDINELENMHRNNFEGNMTLTFTLDMQEGREQFYILENNKFHSLNGYYIYYEKNKAMQEYVLETQPGPCVETESVVKGNSESYRTMLLRKKELMQKRHTVSILYVASTFLIMVVIVLGITLMNNYEKMQSMQNVISDLSKSFINEEIRTSEMPQQAAVTELPISTEEVIQAMSPTVVNAAPEAVTDEMASAAVWTETPTPSPCPSQELKEVESEEQSTPESQNVRKRYEIQPGDTLGAISIKIYNTEEMVDKICEYNQIEDGDQIIAGDVLILP